MKVATRSRVEAAQLANRRERRTPKASWIFLFVISLPLVLVILAWAETWTRVTVSAGFSGDDKAVADIDLDGKPDVIGGTSSGNSTNSLRWWKQSSPLSWTEYVIVSGGSHNFSTEMQVGDMDNDGDIDLVVYDDGHGVGYWRNPKNPDGDPTQQAQWSWQSIGDGGGFVHNLFVGDLNGDGKADVTSKVGYGGAAKVFVQSTPTSFTATSLSGSLGGEGNCMGDIDNDGDLDVITAVSSSPYVKWYENNGSGGGWTPHNGPNTGNGDLCIRVADINQDARNELVVSHSEACGNVSFFATADPKSGLWTEKAVYGTSSCGWHTLQIGDVNHDGKPDILSAQMHGSIMVYYHPGGDALGVWASDQVATTGIHNGVLADVDRNGALDIVGSNYDGDSPVGMYCWRNGFPGFRAIRHAVGDFDGDGSAEAAVDFGAAGAWLWDTGAWTQLTAVNPESMIAADVDGDDAAELLADLGSAGLWLWNGGAWNQLSGANANILSAGDIDADGSDEAVCDFAASGLWLLDGGAWSQLSGANTDHVLTADMNGTGGDEIIGDFGPLGLWVWDSGAWVQLSRLSLDGMEPGETAGGGCLAGDFGPVGLWLWASGAGWTQLSGLDAELVLTANADADVDDEVFADFGFLGLWSWNAGAWDQLTAQDAESMIRADADGEGTPELAVDLGSAGLWLRSFSGAWSQLTGLNPENLEAGDLDGDAADEILADFGSLGLWMWDGGVWAQISPLDPD